MSVWGVVQGFLSLKIKKSKSSNVQESKSERVWSDCRGWKVAKVPPLRRPTRQVEVRKIKSGRSGRDDTPRKGGPKFQAHFVPGALGAPVGMRCCGLWKASPLKG